MERELKLVVPGTAELEALAALLPSGAGPAASEARLEATYHDTADGHLRRAGLSLRVRFDGVTHVQTVKADGPVAVGLFVRPEWERVVPGAAPVIDAATGPIAALTGGRPLRPVFSTEIGRRIRLLDWQGARIEAALDRGVVRAGGSEAAVAELELELKDGSVAALFALARHLGRDMPARLGVQTKSQRGFALAGSGDAAGAVGAERVRLDGQGTVADALAAIAGSGLRQFRLNEDQLLAGSDAPGPVHQARVGLRRLRSALSLFKPLVEGDPRLPALAGGLKSLAATLGEVRDLDVLLAVGDGRWAEPLAAARARAFAAVRARLEAAETRELVLDLAEWLALGDWRQHPADPDAVSGGLLPFAARRLDDARKRVKRAGGRPSRLDDQARHRLRIEAKKLRYAAEFFAGLWPGAKRRRRADRFAEAVEGLQDQLGRLNDLVHGPAVLAGLGLPAEPPRIDRADLKKADRAFEALLDAKRFWR